MHPTLFDPPRARSTDPDTSREAAVSVRPAAELLRIQIRLAAARLGQATREEIAREVESRWPGRWTHGTIVTACAPKRGAGLVAVGKKKNARGGNVDLLEPRL